MLNNPNNFQKIISYYFLNDYKKICETWKDLSKAERSALSSYFKTLSEDQLESFQEEISKINQNIQEDIRSLLEEDLDTPVIKINNQEFTPFEVIQKCNLDPNFAPQFITVIIEKYMDDKEFFNTFMEYLEGIDVIFTRKLKEIIITKYNEIKSGKKQSDIPNDNYIDIKSIEEIINYLTENIDSISEKISPLFLKIYNSYIENMIEACTLSEEKRKEYIDYKVNQLEYLKDKMRGNFSEQFIEKILLEEYKKINERFFML